MIQGLFDWLLELPAWLVLLMAFLFPALEASVFVGVVIPGEIAVLVAGVTASGGRLELWEVIVAAIAGAIIGDFIGFEVGRRWGVVLLAKLPERLIKPHHVERGRHELRRRGAVAVLVGRWTAALRALMPGLAGMSDVRFRTFAIANAIGGTIWVAVVAGLGFAAGTSYERIEKILGNTSWVITGLVVLAVMLLVVQHRVRRRRAVEPVAPSSS